MGTDVLLQHSAESRPQVVKSPVKRVDAVTQRMAAERTHLEKDMVYLLKVNVSYGYLKQ